MLDQNTIEVQTVEGELLVDSRIVAEMLGIEHKSFFETLRKHQLEIEQAFGILRFETEVLFGSGQPPKFALLTDDQCFFLMTLSRNTPQVIAAKVSLVKAFSAARKLLNPETPTIEALHAQIALEFEKTQYRPWSSANPEANQIFRKLVALPSIEASTPQLVPQSGEWAELVSTLGLAANRAGLAGNKSIKEAEFLDKALDKLRSRVLSLESENLQLHRQISDLDDGQVQSLEGENQRLLDRNAELRSEIARFKAAAKISANAIRTLESTIKRLQEKQALSKTKKASPARSPSVKLQVLKSSDPRWGDSTRAIPPGF